MQAPCGVCRQAVQRQSPCSSVIRPRVALGCRASWAVAPNTVLRLGSRQHAANRCRAWGLSSCAAVFPLQQDQEQQQSQSAALQEGPAAGRGHRGWADVLVSRCRTALACLAICAAWSLVATCFSGSPSSGLASLSVAGPGASAPSGVGNAINSAWTGLAAGFLHTLCGPDHLAALTPLTIGRPRLVASALGALWGFGHSTGQLILGLVMVLLKDRFHDFLPALEKWSGLVVAATLIAIGVMGIYESYFEKPDEADTHVGEEAEAMKLALAGAGAGGGGAAAGAGAAGVSTASRIKASLATYATGIVYGLQPDALFVVIPALALPTAAAAVSYCTMFVIGTVLAMGGYTLVIGTTSEALTRERPWLQAHLSTVASAIAILVGVVIGLAGLGWEVPLFSS